MQASVKNIFQLILVFSTLTITGLVAIVLRIVSFDLLLNFNRSILIASSSRFLLKAIGIKLIVPAAKSFPTGCNLITFNHNSYLDVLALTAIGLTQTRFIISEKTLWIIPLTISTIGIGGLYIPQQHDTERRLQFFKNLEKRINRERQNIAASSEGVHHHHHGIDKFNRGVYYIATVCKMDILPLYIHLPEESNPFNKYKAFERGVMTIKMLDTINTTGWKVEEVDNNKDAVRELFVGIFNKEHGMNIK